MILAGPTARRRTAALLVAAGLLAVAACGSDSASDRADAEGWVDVAEGDTYGEWVLYAQVDGDAWTGCLRLDHASGTVERCTDPGGAVVFANDIASIGAVPDDRTLAFADGREVPTHDGGLDVGYEFFVAASAVRDAETGEPVPVAGAAADLDALVGAFEGRWARREPCAGDDRSLTDPASLGSLELAGDELVVAGCAADGEVACRGRFVLVGQTSDGEALETTLRPLGLRCTPDVDAFTELRLRAEGDRLVVDDEVAFERA